MCFYVVMHILLVMNNLMCSGWFSMGKTMDNIIYMTCVRDFSCVCARVYHHIYIYIYPIWTSNNDDVDQPSSLTYLFVQLSWKQICSHPQWHDIILSFTQMLPSRNRKRIDIPKGLGTVQIERTWDIVKQTHKQEILWQQQHAVYGNNDWILAIHRQFMEGFKWFRFGVAALHCKIITTSCGWLEICPSNSLESEYP